jgi:hypothetical protein
MVVVLTIAGDFLDGVPAIAIFMLIIISLSQLGHIHPVHMGVLIPSSAWPSVSSRRPTASSSCCPRPWPA